MHATAYQFVEDVIENVLLPRGPIVDIGGRNINGSVRSLLTRFATTYTGVDLHAGPGVDVVGNVCVYTPPAPPAIVVCCEVFEHAEDACDICAWAHRELQPAGVFIVTAAGATRAPHSGIDGGPLRAGEFYRGVTDDNLRAWLAPFSHCVLARDLAAGDVYAVATK